MAQLPLFPLPETVVFPGMTIPLYIFEERYKMMVKDLLDDEARRFVITLMKPHARVGDGAVPAHRVGAYVDLLRVAENPDGSYNIFAHGQERCLVEDIDSSSHPYHSVDDRPHPLTRSDPNLERVAAWDTLDTFRAYAKAFFAFDAAEQIEANLPDDLYYQASFVCANIRVPANSRQVMLEAPSLVARFQVAHKLMQERLAAHKSAPEESQDKDSYSQEEIEAELSFRSRNGSDEPDDEEDSDSSS